jgi:hypothetical protein
MKYIIIIDNYRGFEYTNKQRFESDLSFYRDPENGYLGRIQVVIE